MPAGMPARRGVLGSGSSDIHTHRRDHWLPPTLIPPLPVRLFLAPIHLPSSIRALTPSSMLPC
eukprot:555593-Rhodomonas_salina.2